MCLPDRTPTNIRIYLEIFLVSSIKQFHFCRSDVSTVQGRGHPRSLNLAPIESTHVPVWHHLGDFAHFFVILTPPYSTLILGVFSLHQIAHVEVNVSRCLKLFGCKIIFLVFQSMLSWYLIITYGRTDR